ncbi:MAG TPA: serine acetyltransferase, partial [Anaeromyxobacteraceae bacterium]|nr:serine acetyltransferase [Anaeromyxobacteraceae bacterium]
MQEARTRKPAVDSVALAPVVEELCREASTLAGFAPGGRVSLPSRDVVIRLVEALRSVLFPGYFGTNDLH